MSNDIVISVDNLGKKYRIPRQAGRERYTALRDVLADKFIAPWRSLRSKLRRAQNNDNSNGSSRSHDLLEPRSSQPSSSQEDFWALRDVSFDVKRGDVLGIIGRNGAGKSTLLKILSRITEPTNGCIEIEGRVASLLEVGTGFHPELTGRENILLNGTILGMTRREIKGKFDEIVAFAEVQKFLDTPVKRYSSGMYVRLAFAVAAHLESEILVIDEVLAVGDAEFQTKCLGKMADLNTTGRTVLFVSHNLPVMSMLCSRAILLRGGAMIAQGPTSTVIREYLHQMDAASDIDLQSRSDRAGQGDVILTHFRILNMSRPYNMTFAIGDDIEFVFQLSREARRTFMRFTLCSIAGVAIAHFNSSSPASNDALGHSASEFRCRVNALPLSPGRYYINVALYDAHGQQDHINNAAYFDVAEGMFAGRPISSHFGYGSVSLAHQWALPFSVDR